MLDALIIWLAKTAAEWAINKLAVKLGHSEMAVHIACVVENAKPLTPDANPPLSHQNNPNKEII